MPSSTTTYCNVLVADTYLLKFPALGTPATQPRSSRSAVPPATSSNLRVSRSRQRNAVARSEIHRTPRANRTSVPMTPGLLGPPIQLSIDKNRYRKSAIRKSMRARCRHPSSRFPSHRLRHRHCSMCSQAHLYLPRFGLKPARIMSVRLHCQRGPGSDYSLKNQHHNPVARKSNKADSRLPNRMSSSHRQRCRRCLQANLHLPVTKPRPTMRTLSNAQSSPKSSKHSRSRTSVAMSSSSAES
jgi:hypothetical protein